MLKRIAIGVIALAIVAAAGMIALAWRPSLAATGPPAAPAFPGDLIAKGEVLAGAGYCATCHTTAGGQTFADGYGLATFFGTIYSTNITSDS